MEKIKQLFLARSITPGHLGRGLFFSYDIFATSKQYGVVVDFNGLQDTQNSERCFSEGVNLVYLCMVNYCKNAKVLGIESEEPLSRDAVEQWGRIVSDEYVSALTFLIKQFADIKKKIDQQSSQNESKLV